MGVVIINCREWVESIGVAARVTSTNLKSVLSSCKRKGGK